MKINVLPPIVISNFLLKIHVLTLNRYQCFTFLRQLIQRQGCSSHHSERAPLQPSCYRGDPDTLTTRPTGQEAGPANRGARSAVGSPRPAVPPTPRPALPAPLSQSSSPRPALPAWLCSGKVWSTRGKGQAHCTEWKTSVWGPESWRLKNQSGVQENSDWGARGLSRGFSAHPGRGGQRLWLRPHGGRRPP